MIVTVIIAWTILSTITGILFCARLKANRREQAEDEFAQFTHRWAERRP